MQIVCHSEAVFSAFKSLIPSVPAPQFIRKLHAFSRERKLPFDHLIAFILSTVANGKHRGIDGKIGQFVKNARRSFLLPDAQTVYPSAITRARRSISWRFFRQVLRDAVTLAYTFFNDDPRYLWHGMSVFAIDGSKYRLPATVEIRDTFDPQSGFSYPGKGHFPQCLVSTAYDVFRRLPVGRTVQAIETGSERDEACALIDEIPPQGIILLDRGYPGFSLIDCMQKNYRGYFIIRCPATCTFSAVVDFVAGGTEEEIITLTPSKVLVRQYQNEGRPVPDPIRVRAIRMESSDGTVSVLITNLLDTQEFPVDEIFELYTKRWNVEGYYRDEKVYLDIETFHSRSVNGILQELFAVMIMSVIARILMMLEKDTQPDRKNTPQFKNAVMAVADEIAFLTANNPRAAVRMFTDLLQEVQLVRYNRHKKKRKPQPRINKQPVNKWKRNRQSILGLSVC